MLPIRTIKSKNLISSSKKCELITSYVNVKVIDQNKSSLKKYSIHYFIDNNSNSNSLIQVKDNQWKLVYYPTASAKRCSRPKSITFLFFKEGFHFARTGAYRFDTNFNLPTIELIEIGSNYKSQNIQYRGTYTDVEHALKQIDKSLEKKINDQSSDRKGMQPGETIRN